jgi:hypothetical protein
MYESIRPGQVGAVGDVIGNIRLKHSAPELPIRWEYDLGEFFRFGAHVEDGFHPYHKDYLGILPVGMLMNRNDFQTNYGWKYQDLRAPDKTYQPEMSQTFSNFDNLRATVINSTRTGIQFRKLPNGYAPKEGDVSRGGQVPRITDLAAGDFTLDQTSVVTARQPNQIPVDTDGRPRVYQTFRHGKGSFGEKRR